MLKWLPNCHTLKFVPKGCRLYQSSQIQLINSTSHTKCRIFFKILNLTPGGGCPFSGLVFCFILEIVKTMSCDDLTVIFQKLQICLLIFHQKSDEGADRNANSYNLIKKKNIYFLSITFKKSNVI